MATKTQPVLEMALEPKPQPALDITAQIVELSANPQFDVAKLEALVQMHERATARVSEEQFNAAMNAAQAGMRSIEADAYNKQTSSRYATYAALDRVLRPIYTEHGFGLSFDTGDSPAPDTVRVLCYVTHRGGHKRTYKADMPADGKGAKGGDVMTRTHATGAAMQYGMRYLLKMIFNVAVGEADDDGNSASAKPAIEMPAGFQDWWDDMKSVADEGLEALQAAWAESDRARKLYVTKVNPKAWDELKKHAEKQGGVK